MDRTYKFRTIIEELLDQMTHFRPNKAIVHTIEDNVVNLSLGGFPSLIKSVRVIGDIKTLAPGDSVDILWDQNRPVVLLGGVAGTASTGTAAASVSVDNKTLERSYEGLRVKAGGIGMRHLNFAPALVDHMHDNPLYEGGWDVTEEGVLFNGLTSIHPNGDITLGESPNMIQLSSSDPKYRLWAGAAGGAFANFSVDVDGKISAKAGSIGGWQLGEKAIFSDVGIDGKPKAEIDSSTPHIQLGGASYIDGAGFWVGKYGSVYRLRIGDDQSFLRWTGSQLEIQGDMQSSDYSPGTAGWRVSYSGLAEFRSGIIGGWNISGSYLESDNGNVKLASNVPSIAMGAAGYLSGAGFWVGKDGADYKIFIGDEEQFLVWNGDALLISADFRSSNYIPGISGWAAKPSGDAEFHNVTVRGSLKSSVVEYGQVMAVDGGLIITKTSSLVLNDFTASSTSFDVDVRIPDGVSASDIGNYYAVDDVVRVKSGTINFWGIVIQTTNNISKWTIRVNKITPTFDVEVLAGATLLNYGASGNGVIEIDGAAPKIRLYSHVGSPHTEVSDFVILGNLKDHFDFTDTKLGLGVGDPNKLKDYLLVTEDGLEMSGEIRIGTEGYDLGVGFWAGKVDSVAQLRIGDPSGYRLEWDGTRLTLIGDIVITGGSGVENLEGLGALATQDAVGWDQVTGENKPESNATVGATWGQNLFNVPAPLQDPTAGGLYLSAEKMGYFSGTQWVTYIDNTGKFYFKGNSSAYLSWDPNSNMLYGHDGTNIQWFASSEDGKLYAGAGSVVLDELGIKILGDRAAFYFIDSDMPVGTMRITEDLYGAKIIKIINGLDESDINLITNPGFETDTTGWTMAGNGTLPARSTEAYYTGGASLKFTPALMPEDYLMTEDNNNIVTEDLDRILVYNPSTIIQNDATSTKISTEAGQTLGVRAMVYHPNKDYMNFTAHALIYNSSDVLVREKEFSYDSLVFNQWSMISTIINVNAGEAKVAVRFRVNQGYGGIDASPQGLFIDDVGVYDLSKFDSQISLGMDYISLESDRTYVNGDLETKGTQKGGQTVYLQVFYADEDLETGTGLLFFTVPLALDGCKIKDFDIAVYTPSTSGNPTVQCYNVTKALNLLSTTARIDVNEKSSYTAATQPVINQSNNTINVGDILRIDVSAKGTGTKGLDVIMIASQP